MSQFPDYILAVKISFACYLVDTYCTGVKDSLYKLRIEEEDFNDFLEKLSEVSELEECSYEEAHNIIYGAVDFAEEIEITPDDSFRLTRYMLKKTQKIYHSLSMSLAKMASTFLLLSTHILPVNIFPN